MKKEEETFEVPIIQFMRPNGRIEHRKSNLPKIYLEKYASMIKAGCRFEAEVLTNGLVSVTISNCDEDIDCSITKNGPGVKKGMLIMLNSEKWLK